jgi:hypothetical protein
MKKLGFMEGEGCSTDDALLSYFKMFGGPLSGGLRTGCPGADSPLWP